MTATALQAFIRKYKVRMAAAQTDRNPYAGPDWAADHWKCVLRCQGRKMGTYFSKGFAHKGKPPTAAEVLNYLASDSLGWENAQGFEDWCGEYGYDTDSIKSLRVYRRCQRQAEKLAALLGTEAYRELLYDVERL